MFYNKKEPF